MREPPTTDVEILAHARALATRIARRHGMFLSDEILSDAFLGYTEALRTWSPDGGAAFETFAYARVRGAILDGGRKRRLFGPIRTRVSMVRPERSGYFEDQIPAPAAEDDAPECDEREEIRALLEHLDDRERALVVGVYFEDRPSHKVAADLGISQSYATRIRQGAEAKIRDWIENGAPVTRPAPLRFPDPIQDGGFRWEIGGVFDGGIVCVRSWQIEGRKVPRVPSYFVGLDGRLRPNSRGRELPSRVREWVAGWCAANVGAGSEAA